MGMEVSDTGAELTFGQSGDQRAEKGWLEAGDKSSQLNGPISLLFGRVGAVVLTQELCTPHLLRLTCANWQSFMSPRTGHRGNLDRICRDIFEERKCGLRGDWQSTGWCWPLGTCHQPNPFDQSLPSDMLGPLSQYTYSDGDGEAPVE